MTEQLISIPPCTIVYSEKFGWGETFTGITGRHEHCTVRFEHGRELFSAVEIMDKLIPAAEEKKPERPE